MAIPKMQSKMSTTLAQSLDASSGVIYLTENVTEDLGFLVIDRGAASEEIIKYASKGSGYVSGCTRALSTVGTAETAGTGKTHATGSSVEMTNAHYYFARIIDAINGVSSTSANNFDIGAGSASLSSQGNSFYRIQTSAGKQFQIGLSTNGFAVWTEDQGVNYNRLSATGGAVNAGVAWENVGGVGNVKISALISAAGGISSVSDRLVVNQAADFIWGGTNFDVSATNFKIKNTTVSATAEELNKVYSLSAYSGVTMYKLNLLTDGGSVSGQSLHTHGFKMGYNTATTSSQNIFINSTFQPKLIEILATGSTQDNNTYVQAIASHGWYNSDGQWAQYWNAFRDGTGQQGLHTGITVAQIIQCFSATVGWGGTIDSVATSGFTLALTITGAGGTLSYSWKAQN